MDTNAHDELVECPNCQYRVPFLPNTTYRCLNCDTRFFTRRDDRRAYPHREGKFRSAIAQVFLLMSVAALTVWELDMLDWFGGRYARYWPVVPWVIGISLLLAFCCIKWKD